MWRGTWCGEGRDGGARGQKQRLPAAGCTGHVRGECARAECGVHAPPPASRGVVVALTGGEEINLLPSAGGSALRAGRRCERHGAHGAAQGAGAGAPEVGADWCSRHAGSPPRGRHRPGAVHAHASLTRCTVASGVPRPAREPREGSPSTLLCEVCSNPDAVAPVPSPDTPLNSWGRKAPRSRLRVQFPGPVGPTSTLQGAGAASSGAARAGSARQGMVGGAVGARPVNARGISAF